ncbi:MAG TPA: MFS transporter, partial [Fimbriimonadaceae bacterium]|nr:MFS transporter [Fimbriimonadaceae bacterium]
MWALRQNLMRAFQHRDFRLLWIGAFLSFVGSWIQNVAQGWLVYELTHDKAKLAIVTFCQMAPVSVFGPFAGAFADTFNKRKLLVFAQSVFALGAIYLMLATHYGFVRYEHILVVALIFGLTGCIEMPARQSVVSNVVPPEDLAAAIPLNAMTFNVARIIGPAIGGFLVYRFGPSICYGINGFSYIAIILSVLVIKTDLSAVRRAAQPIGDLLFEGMKYTFQDRRLRMLFTMEATMSTFGLFYLSQMPAIATEMLRLDQRGYGFAMTTVGFGAIAGLLLNTVLSHRELKAKIVLTAMTVSGVTLLALGFTRMPIFAFPLLAIIGMSAIMQFNTTNTLFQTLSPEHLRGRVLAMHIYAISGVGPFGILFFGWLAETTKGPTI